MKAVKATTRWILRTAVVGVAIAAVVAGGYAWRRSGTLTRVYGPAAGPRVPVLGATSSERPGFGHGDRGDFARFGDGGPPFGDFGGFDGPTDQGGRGGFGGFRDSGGFDPRHGRAGHGARTGEWFSTAALSGFKTTLVPLAVAIAVISVVDAMRRRRRRRAPAGGRKFTAGP